MSTADQGHAKTSYASDPGRVTLSHDKLRALRPDLYGVSGLWKSLRASLGLGRCLRAFVAEQLQLGDSRAALVMSTSPLLVAAYTDELDCVAMLQFSASLVAQYGLSPGARLLTVNFYGNARTYDSDLLPGPNAILHWTGFQPLIAEFLTDDLARVEARKQSIAEDEWRRAHTMGLQYMEMRPGVARDGRPGYASYPALVLMGA